MAEPLKEIPGPLATLESAVRLLRGAPFTTVAYHWLGSIPFALMLLRFWNDATNPRIAAATLAGEAAALAVLLVWMNIWRAVYAGEMRRRLSNSRDPVWTGERIWNLVCGQAFAGAAKVLALPLALVAVFPFASAVTTFRVAAVLAGREDSDARKLLSRARRLSTRYQRQNWGLLPPLLLLYLLLAANVAIVLGFLPQIVRVLTGYESAFSRSGIYFVFNPLFILLAIAASWIVFDPFMQAVYCVRCFQAESLETGEDLLAAIRRVRSYAAVPALLLLAALPALLQASVPPPELQQSVQKTMQSHEYDWRLPPPETGPRHSSWLSRMADRLIAGVRSVTEMLFDILRRLFRWLFHREPMGSVGGASPRQGLHWSLWVLIGAVTAAAVLIAWSKRRSLRREVRVAAAPIASISLDAEDLTADRLPEEQWLAIAEQAFGEENYRLALRALYLANLAWLGRRELISIQASKTNREYETELRRKARAFPEMRGLFAGNIAAFERAWYGLHDVAPDDVGEFRSRNERMKQEAAA